MHQGSSDDERVQSLDSKAVSQMVQPRGETWCGRDVCKASVGTSVSSCCC